MRLKLHYSVQNGGDGSAYPKFMESKDLAEFDQDHMDEGWGESCTGTITLESDSDIKCLDQIQTKESYFIEKYCDGWRAKGKDKEKEEFVSKFFPNGLPVFSVETKNVKAAGYLDNYVYVNGKCVATTFREAAKSGKVFEDFLNNL